MKGTSRKQIRWQNLGKSQFAESEILLNILSKGPILNFFEHIQEMAMVINCCSLFRVQPLVIISLTTGHYCVNLFLSLVSIFTWVYSEILKKFRHQKFRSDKEEFSTGVRLKSQSTWNPLFHSTPPHPSVPSVPIFMWSYKIKTWLKVIFYRATFEALWGTKLDMSFHKKFFLD